MLRIRLWIFPYTMFLCSDINLKGGFGASKIFMHKHNVNLFEFFKINFWVSWTVVEQRNQGMLFKKKLIWFLREKERSRCMKIKKTLLLSTSPSLLLQITLKAKPFIAGKGALHRHHAAHNPLNVSVQVRHHVCLNLFFIYKGKIS